eukprot:jgi/Chlat1/1147/Chrsp112S01613
MPSGMSLPGQTAALPPELLRIIGEHLPLGEELRFIHALPPGLAAAGWAASPALRWAKVLPPSLLRLNAGPSLCNVIALGDSTEDIASSSVDNVMQAFLGAEDCHIAGGAWRGFHDYSNLVAVGVNADDSDDANDSDGSDEVWAAAEDDCHCNAMDRDKARFALNWPSHRLPSLWRRSLVDAATELRVTLQLHVQKGSELGLRAQALLQDRLWKLLQDQTSVYCLTCGEVSHHADDEECMFYTPWRVEWRRELQEAPIHARQQRNREKKRMMLEDIGPKSTCLCGVKPAVKCAVNMCKLCCVNRFDADKRILCNRHRCI